MMKALVLLLVALASLRATSTTALVVTNFIYPTTCSGSVPPPSDYPKRMTLRTLTIDVVPFTFRDDNGTFTGGFLYDLLQEIKQRASKDGVELTFDVDKGPESYDGALNYIANDCNTTANPLSEEDCNRYDFVLGDYWPNPTRYERVEFSPRWLETGLCTMKYVHESRTLQDITTLAEAARAGAKVCTLAESALPEMLENNFPGVIHHLCPTNEACIEDLKAEKCSLFSQDYLTLLYQSLRDSTLEVTKELFQPQPIVFPIRRNLDPTVAYLLQRWLYKASYESTFDRLFQQYFRAQLCPIGTAGPDCDQPCDPTHGTSGFTGDCICESTKWTGGDCSIEVMEEMNRIPTTLLVLGYSMFGNNLGVVLVCLAWLVWSRKTPQVAVAQPLFLSLILLGCAISTSTIIALSQEDSSAACMAVPWLYSVGFCVTFGTLFAKIRRVRVLLRNAIKMRRVAVTTSQTFGTICIFLFFDVVILSLWTALDPLEWRRTVISTDKFGEILESEAHCTSEHWRAWAGTIGALHGCLLLFASYSCYQLRNVSTSFSEAKYLTIAMVSNLQMFLVGVPVLVIVTGDPETSYFLQCLIIYVNDLAVVVLIFGNLMYHAHMGRHRLRTTQSLIRVSMQEYGSSSAANIESNRAFVAPPLNLKESYNFEIANPVAQPIIHNSNHSNSTEKDKDPEAGDGALTKPTSSESPLLSPTAQPAPPMSPLTADEGANWTGEEEAQA